jgi:UDP-N-acetylmuramyl pentapeptide phosphotransferase/UDP-N-acetylglucosamine-1-phosphate transferase
VQALPLITALFVAIVLAPPALAALGDGPLARVNYRGATLPAPLGLLIVAAALVALIPLGFAQQLIDSTLLRPELGWISIYVLGVAFLGLADDALSAPATATRAPGAQARGWRGHWQVVRHGGFSTGALKAVGAAGLALFALSGLGWSTGHYLLAAGVLVLSTNFFNLLDLRPGRASKALGLLGIALTVGAADVHPLWALGVFVGPALVAGAYDLRELGMLGDTGSNVLGAIAGAWLVLTLSTAGAAIALVVLAAATAYGEFRSISAFVERTPGLRELDSLGRPRHAPDH